MSDSSSFDISAEYNKQFGSGKFSNLNHQFSTSANPGSNDLFRRPLINENINIPASSSSIQHGRRLGNTNLSTLSRLISSENFSAASESIDISEDEESYSIDDMKSKVNLNDSKLSNRYVPTAAPKATAAPTTDFSFLPKAAQERIAAAKAAKEAELNPRPKAQLDRHASGSSVDIDVEAVAEADFSASISYDSGNNSKSQSIDIESFKQSLQQTYQDLKSTQSLITNREEQLKSQREEQLRQQKLDTEASRRALEAVEAQAKLNPPQEIPLIARLKANEAKTAAERAENKVSTVQGGHFSRPGQLQSSDFLGSDISGPNVDKLAESGDNVSISFEATQDPAQPISVNVSTILNSTAAPGNPPENAAAKSSPLQSMEFLKKELMASEEFLQKPAGAIDWSVSSSGVASSGANNLNSKGQLEENPGLQTAEFSTMTETGRFSRVEFPAVSSNPPTKPNFTSTGMSDVSITLSTTQQSNLTNSINSNLDLSRNPTENPANPKSSSVPAANSGAKELTLTENLIVATGLEEPKLSTPRQTAATGPKSSQPTLETSPNAVMKKTAPSAAAEPIESKSENSEPIVAVNKLGKPSGKANIKGFSTASQQASSITDLPSFRSEASATGPSTSPAPAPAKIKPPGSLNKLKQGINSQKRVSLTARETSPVPNKPSTGSTSAAATKFATKSAQKRPQTAANPAVHHHAHGFEPENSGTLGNQQQHARNPGHSTPSSGISTDSTTNLANKAKNLALERRIAQLESHIAADTDFSQSQRIGNSVKQQISQLEERLKASETALSTVREELASERTKSQQNSADLVLWEQEKLNLTVEINNLRANSHAVSYREMIAAGGALEKGLFEAKEREKIQNELKNMETLISGLNKENQRLTQELRTQSTSRKGAEHYLFNENHSLKQENQALQAKVSSLQANLHSNSDLAAQKMIEKLQIELDLVKNQSAGEKGELRMELDKLREQGIFSEGRKAGQLHSHSNSSGNLIEKSLFDDLQRAHEVLHLQKEKEVNGLQAKLLFYIENQQIIDDFSAKEKQYKQKVDNLNQKVAYLTNLLPKSAKTKLESAPNSAEELNFAQKSKASDLRKIKSLEKHVSELQNVIKHNNPDSIAHLLSAAKSSSEENEAVIELKQLNEQLSQQLAAKDEELQQKMRALRQEHDKLRAMYEKKLISAQQNNLRDTKLGLKAKNKSLAERQLEELTNKLSKQVEELQEQLENKDSQLQKLQAVASEHKESPTEPSPPEKAPSRPQSPLKSRADSLTVPAPTKSASPVKRSINFHSSGPQGHHSSAAATTEKQFSLLKQALQEGHDREIKQLSARYEVMLQNLKENSAERLERTEQRSQQDIEQYKLEKQLLSAELAQFKQTLAQEQQTIRSQLSKIQQQTVELSALKASPLSIQYSQLANKLEFLTQQFQEKEAQYSQQADIHREELKHERILINEKYELIIAEKNKKIQLFQLELDALLQGMRKLQLNQGHSSRQPARNASSRPAMDIYDTSSEQQELLAAQGHNSLRPLSASPGFRSELKFNSYFREQV
jgi:hypothetical protein